MTDTYSSVSYEDKDPQQGSYPSENFINSQHSDMNDSLELHHQDIADDQKRAIAETIWKADNVELTTVGIDIGSSTSHLMFAKVHLQRKSQLLSSQFVVVSREILWRSPILLTPFLSDNTIDAGQLQTFIQDAYKQAGLSPKDIDSGAVILTGEAIKRKNASAIAELFAADSGKFVCASAGHHMECILAGHGSGAVVHSRETQQTILNVDIGGGTTKLALIKNGKVISTCAFAVGGRLLACADDGRLLRIDGPAQQTAKMLGMDIEIDQQISESDIDRVVNAMSDVVISILQQNPSAWSKELLLTPPMPDDLPKPDFITFSGGVSEYIYNRENAVYGDIAKPLADKITEALSNGRISIPLLDPGQGIRATVIGASQFSVQVSGTTIHISQDMELPVHNIPVLFPSLSLDENFSVSHVATQLSTAFTRAELRDGQAMAVAIKWQGDPHYHRLRCLADGIAQALVTAAHNNAPLIIMLDGDIGKLLGYILEHEVKIENHLVSIDGIQLQEFDYVDIGAVIQPTNVVPVVIKSLLFSA